MKRITLLMIILSSLIVLPAFAAIINIPDDYPTIQRGINVSIDGDTVLVQPEIYVEYINFNGHNIVLGSLFLTTGDTTYIYETIIDGGGSSSVARFMDGEDSTTIITGFTLTNSRSGIYCNNSSPTISNNFIMGNHSNSNGGGIACFNSSSPVIINNTISLNTAELTGGGIYCQDSNPFIYGNIIDSNTAINAGGGICCSNSSPRIENNILIGNHAENNYGGGIAGFSSSAPEIIGNTISLNTSNFEGGGLCFYTSNPVIDNNIISGNIALEQGGGIFAQGSNIIARQNEIYDNTARYGGGIHCNNSFSRFEYTIISGNIALNGGGGMDNIGGAPELYNCEITGNSAGNYGGGISNDMSSPIITNCLIAGNNASGAGGGISNYTYSQAVLLNCTFSDNSADYGGAIWNGASTPSLVNCILWGDFPDEHSGSESIITYSNIQGGWEGEGNIDIDPLFRDPENGDFHLMSTECGDPYDSPSIDTGSPAIIDSLLNCDWGLGTILSDMGAYGGGDSATVAIDDFIERLPSQLALLQNYPNPFNPTTTIRYSLPEISDVKIQIYNILGQCVATLFEGNKQSGYHTITWHADDFPSGVYFARLRTLNESKSIKMLLLR